MCGDVIRRHAPLEGQSAVRTRQHEGIPSGAAIALGLATDGGPLMQSVPTFRSIEAKGPCRAKFDGRDYQPKAPWPGEGETFPKNARVAYRYKRIE
jgi:hypothetical protein